MNEDEIRIEVRLRNNRLYEATAGTFGRVSTFCKRTNMCQSDVGALINLKKSPFVKSLSKQGSGNYFYTPTARKLAEICGYCCEELFPVELYEKVSTPLVVRTMSVNRVLALQDERKELSVNEIGFEVIKKKVIKEALNSMPENCKKIIEDRFGIASGVPLTLEECAARRNVTRERIRQVEARGIRMLRHPTRAYKLREK